MRFYSFVLTLIVLGRISTGHSSENEERLARRIQAHLTIKDYSFAVYEAQLALKLYPRSKSIHEGYVRSLAKLGDEKKLLQAWNKYIQQFPAQGENRELIEEMAWGVLQKASYSSS